MCLEFQLCWCISDCKDTVPQVSQEHVLGGRQGVRQGPLVSLIQETHTGRRAVSGDGLFQVVPRLLACITW
jgi:hypothetical protein